MQYHPFQRAKTAIRQGFTLLEMAIVLAVIGLIIGGIVAGRELVHASQMQSMITDMNSFKSALEGFKLKYNGLPGDLEDATRYWGTYSGTCNAPATCNDIDSCNSQATCDGNGDGRIGGDTDGRYEILRLWQHLSNAGMINGQYSGLPGSLGYSLTAQAGDHRLNVNAPSSRIGGVGYTIMNMGTQSSNPGSSQYAGYYGNTLIIGGAADGYETGRFAFTAAEAWEVDKKIDDGMPGMGRLVVGTVWRAAGNTCTDGTADLAATAVYRVGLPGKQCNFYYKMIGEK